VDALAVPLDLAVKNRVLVLGQHLLLRRHLRLPALDLLHAESEARKRTVERRDDAVDVPETLALAVLLVARQAPRDFPLRLLEMHPRSLFRGGFQCGPGGGGAAGQRRRMVGMAYQSRPPDSGFVERKAPNMAAGNRRGVDMDDAEAWLRYLDMRERDSRGLPWRGSLLARPQHRPSSLAPLRIPHPALHWAIYLSIRQPARAPHRTPDRRNVVHLLDPVAPRRAPLHPRLRHLALRR
jgi:hypothetical protein